MKSRPNAVLAVTAVLVAAMAVAALLLTTLRKAPEPDLATPEGTVQAYLTAIADHDDARAVELLDPELGCSAPLPEGFRQDGMAASLVSTRTDGDRATVVVELTNYSGDALSSWSERIEFRLVDRGAGWLLTGDVWPYFGCE